jgi:MYXO-CTERM domain-containing protein
MGVEDDASIIAPPVDQGGTGVDQGPRGDLGTVDGGGATGTPTVGFQGGGGCHISAEGQSGRHAAGFAVLVALAGLIARRRRS